MNKGHLQAFIIMALLLTFNAYVFAEDKSVTVQLKVNEEVSFDEGNLVIHLVRIIEDIRCPDNVDCGHAGHVKIEITAKIGYSDYGHHFICNVDNDNRNQTSEIKLSKYTIKLNFRGVQPEREHLGIGSGKGIAEIMQEEYTVELVISQ